MRASTAALLAALFVSAAGHAAEPWVADLGNGSYQNPVLHADYSDPDAIRVGDTYYMTSSSFNSAPGLPLLESKDMVNWTLVGHALPRLVPEAYFAVPRLGAAVWAPCLRYHDGRFWIFYPDPDFGIYVITAQRFSGPWSKPHLLLAGRGIIDPTPLWDDDGKAWLLHAWARSRAGINNQLTLHAMAPDASHLLDTAGKTIIDANKLPGYRTLEGPKLYKHDGWYYVFAPAGGVEEGWQSVFRSRSIEGPYEDRIVMDQGLTAINGPHQGAWVRAQDGSDWFLHFQDKKAYGRVVHLQPMQWKDEWPIIGLPGPKPGIGNPVTTWRKPVAGQAFAAPPTSDEFKQPALGLQWQWNANPQPGWYSLTARPGYLRLFTQLGHADIRLVPNLLGQKLPAPGFSVDTRIELHDAADGDTAGLLINGLAYAWLGLRKSGADQQLVYTICTTPLGPACKPQETVLLAHAPAAMSLRMAIGEGALARFAYSTDGRAFTAAGPAFAATKGTWVGAQMDLFSVGSGKGYVDVDAFRVTPAQPSFRAP